MQDKYEKLLEALTVAVKSLGGDIRDLKSEILHLREVIEEAEKSVKLNSKVLIEKRG